MWIATDNGHLYVWVGTQWDDAGPLGTSTTTTADIPPSNPKDGDMWWESDSGIFWVYYDDGNTSQWVQAGGTAASINQNFVLKTGDTMTGNLTISSTNAVLLLNSAIGSVSAIQGQKAGVVRWNIVPGEFTAESGGNAGSNFIIQRFNDAGGIIGEALSITRATGATTLSSTVPSTSPTTGALTVAGGVGVGGDVVAGGNVSVIKPSPTLVLNKPVSGHISAIVGQTANNSRWSVYLGDNAAEAGSNAGSDFVIVNHTDVGTGIAAALKINRANTSVALASVVPSTSPTTGALTVGGGLGVGGGICIGASGPIPAIGGSVRLGIAAGNAGFSTRPATDTNQWHYTFENAAGGLVGNISTTVSATAYATSSDASLKEDLKSFDAGNIIDNTEVYDFAWKSTKERAFGIIAQQAVEVYPQAITHTEASTEKGLERDEWWGVDYSKYVPVLLQELKALRARVAELEGRIVEKPSTTPRGRK